MWVLGVPTQVELVANGAAVLEVESVYRFGILTICRSLGVGPPTRWETALLRHGIQHWVYASGSKMKTIGMLIGGSRQWLTS